MREVGGGIRWRAFSLSLVNTSDLTFCGLGALIF